MFTVSLFLFFGGIVFLGLSLIFLGGCEDTLTVIGIITTIILLGSGLILLGIDTLQFLGVI
jgi:hypothetical protein